ncbi:MAG: hypothetical protein AB1327_08035 [Bacillota bacterium]
MIFENADQLAEKCAEWQRILRLQDWDVITKIVRSDDMHSDGQGECTWVIERKEAIIKLLDPVDYSPRSPFEQDHERTLVHELLHLHFAPFTAKDGTLEDIAQEQAIQCFAKAFVELKRRCTNE